MADLSDIGPWAATPEWVLDAEISDRAVRLFGLLARYANRDDRAIPGVSTLARRLRCSQSTARTALAELEELGAIERRPRRREDGSQTSNEIFVCFIAPRARRGPAEEPEGPPADSPEAKNESHEGTKASPHGDGAASAGAIIREVFQAGTPRTLIGSYLKAVKSLLDEGIAPEEVRAAARLGAQRSRPASALPYLVQEVRAGPAPDGYRPYSDRQEGW